MPFRKSKGWGNTKPPVGTQVDWGDPINRSLMACYTFAEGAGSKTYDASGLGHSGTMTLAPPWANGALGGKSLSFNGSTEAYISSSGFAYTGIGQLTMTCWLNPAAAGAQNHGIIVWRGGGSTVTGMIFSGTGILGYMWQDSSSAYLWKGGPVPTVGAWNFVVLTINLGNAQYYMWSNGVLTSASNTFSSTAAILNNVQIGRDPLGGRVYNGLIDNVRIYNRILSQSEAQRLYTEPFAGLIAPRRRIISAVAGGGLVANNIATGSPVLGSATLKQTHALSAVSLATGSPVLGAPSLSRNLDQLTAARLATPSPVLGTPSVGQKNVLAASSLATGSPVLGTPTFGTNVYPLTATGIVIGSPSLGKPDIGPLPSAVYRGAPVWWKGWPYDEDEEEEKEDVINEIGIVPTNETITETEAIARAVPLNVYEAIESRVRAQMSGEIQEMVIEREIVKQVKRRVKRMREDEEILLLS